MTAPIPATSQGSPSEEDGEPWLGYIRVSTWKEEKISPELQETAIRAWAARTGKRILDPLIIDLDMTGRNFRRRIMGGIKRVEAGEAAGIVVWKYSRFGRTRDGVPLNLKRLEDAGGQLASATEEVDARTATGRLQRGILFEFAAYESDIRGEQWKETHDHRRYKLHLPATGKRRFGYIWTPRRVPDPDSPVGFRIQEESYRADPVTGPVMADAYRAYADGATFYALVASLNDAGHRTLRGGAWTVQTFIRYMDSGFCAALLRIHDPACTCPPEKRGNCTTPHLFIPGAQEELIDAELWQLYRERREQIKKTPPRARRALYPLTNLVRCGGCRGTTPVHSVQRWKGKQATNVQGYSYACGKRGTTGTKGCPGVWAIRTRIEAQVLTWLRDEVAEEVDATPAIPVQRKSGEDERVAAARERARLEVEAAKQARGLLNLRTQRALDPDEFAPGEYEAARDKIRAQQKATLAALDRVATIESTPIRSDYRLLLVGLLDAWEEMSDAERNGLLRQLVRRVVLVRTEGPATIVVHPVWKPDPWAAAAPVK
ncbi:recombinase family protein [Streptomyces sp. NBC_01754]|uniref:recombinase family protein n=1 Tax=Streptomyces sp. NBC_01754 TaxID=2975930 RepID=UPI002DDC4617|nr:recombinase family protein [Streptomyces sp. NBC_01754]WSC92965.1 recombinase family protein [Streptomyces sp. NBC_01754]